MNNLLVVLAVAFAVPVGWSQAAFAQQKILASISSCTTPVVFDAISVRARDER